MNEEMFDSAKEPTPEENKTADTSNESSQAPEATDQLSEVGEVHMVISGSSVHIQQAIQELQEVGYADAAEWDTVTMKGDGSGEDGEDNSESVSTLRRST